MASSSSNAHSASSSSKSPPRRHTFFSPTPKYTSEASSSDGGRSLEDQRYDSSPMDTSRASSPLLNEKEHAESLLMQWQQSQKGLEPSPFSAEGAALAARKREKQQQQASTASSSSSSTHKSSRRLTRPLYALRDGALRAATKSRVGGRPSAKIKWGLRILTGFVAFVILSALFPNARWSPWYRSSSLGGFVEPDWDPTATRNQELAAGKSWGWKLDDKLKTGPVGGDPKTPAQKHKDVHDFSYPAQQHEAAGLYPDIPCQLDAAEFGRHYKLTPKYRYARRYVTARAQAPDLDRPEGFDPIPRKLNQSIVHGWDSLEWQGQSVDELCRNAGDAEAKKACIEKEKKKKAVREAREQYHRTAKKNAAKVIEAAAAKAAKAEGEGAAGQAGGVVKGRDAVAGPILKDAAGNGAPQLAAAAGAAGAADNKAANGAPLPAAAALGGAKVDDDAPTINATPLRSCSSSLQPLELPVYPTPRTRTQPHNLVLGLASVVDRIFDYLPELSFSFAYSNLHILLNLPTHPRMQELRKALKARGITATIIESTEEDYLRRWAELPALLRDFSDPDLTQWAIVSDDDTFFFSMPKVLKMLDKYDPVKPHYIGAMTEDWRQSRSGMIAYGGGGVFLSLPLLDQLTEHWSKCKESGDPADHRLAFCIYSNTHTRLSIEFGLMQADIYGDIRGLLESGREIATMHHWRTWNVGFDPLKMARASVPCGSECVLQRFLLDSPQTDPTLPGVTAAEKFLFVHGLSLTLYSDPLPDFSHAEVTWRVWPDSEFAHALGPSRPRVREGRPLFSRTRDHAHRSKARVSQRSLLLDGGNVSDSSTPPLPVVNKRAGSPGAGGAASSSHWKESWMLEDVRLDTKKGGLPSEWDGDGRGIREIYIKRANRAKGYVTAGEVDQKALAEDEELRANLAADSIDPAEEHHRDLETSVKGLIGKLFGHGPSVSDADRLIAEEIAREEIALEEEDSVIELIWI